jgi:hypothetical protein
MVVNGNIAAVKENSVEVTGKGVNRDKLEGN